MRKKSVLLASVGLAMLVGLVGVVVVWAQSGAEENPPHAVARALTEEELAAGEEMEVHYFDSYEEAMEFTGADPADFQPPTSSDVVVGLVGISGALVQEASGQGVEPPVGTPQPDLPSSSDAVTAQAVNPDELSLVSRPLPQARGTPGVPVAGVGWAQGPRAEGEPPIRPAKTISGDELQVGDTTAENSPVTTLSSHGAALESTNLDAVTFEGQAAGEIQAAVADAPDSASESLARPASADEQQAILQTVQTLAAQWSGAVLKRNGWIHVVTHRTRDKDKVSSLPNGQAIPLNYISETWYHLDDQGQAVEVIAFMRSEGGEPVQISTFRGNIWRNLTVGEKWDGEPFMPRPDLGFSADAAQAREWGSTLSQQTVTLAGRTALRFTMRDEFGSPLLMEGYAQPVISAERRAYFDARSGALLLLERILVTADGRERVVERVDQITVQQGVEPPSDVLALLQQEVTK